MLISYIKTNQMRKEKIFLLYSTFIIFFFNLKVYGNNEPKPVQGLKVSGTVIGAEDGIPIPGVTIMEKVLIMVPLQTLMGIMKSQYRVVMLCWYFLLLDLKLRK